LTLIDRTIALTPSNVPVIFRHGDQLLLSLPLSIDDYLASSTVIHLGTLEVDQKGKIPPSGVVGNLNNAIVSISAYQSSDKHESTWLLVAKDFTDEDYLEIFEIQYEEFEKFLSLRAKGK